MPAAARQRSSPSGWNPLGQLCVLPSLSEGVLAAVRRSCTQTRRKRSSRAHTVCAFISVFSFYFKTRCTRSAAGVGAGGIGSMGGWSGCDWCAGNQCVAWTPGTIILLKTSVQVHACMRAAGATCRDALTRRRLLSGMHRARSRSVRMRRQVEICWSCCSPSQNCCL